MNRGDIKTMVGDIITTEQQFGNDVTKDEYSHNCHISTRVKCRSKRPSAKSCNVDECIMETSLFLPDT